MPKAENAWRRLLLRAQRSRPLSAALLLAGVYLLALPLVFTVFSREVGPGHHFERRVELTVVWFLCALLVGAVATERDLTQLAQQTRDQLIQQALEVIPRRRRAGDRRELAALASISALLRPGATGLSQSFRFAAFIPDQQGFLVPVLEANPEPWQRWPPGCGVVGIAWVNPDDFVQAVGAETVDPQLGLTPQQLERYGKLTYVGARAIFDENDRLIGVLSVGCEDGSDFAAAQGPERFRLLASDMGVLVGDAQAGRL